MTDPQTTEPDEPNAGQLLAHRPSPQAPEVAASLPQGGSMYTPNLIDFQEYAGRPRAPREARSIPRPARVERAIARLLDVLGEERLCVFANLADNQLESLTAWVPRDSQTARAELLADLETWPQAFQRRLRPLLDRDAIGSLARRFDEARSSGNLYGIQRASSCGCGCNGMNTELARWLGSIREHAAEVTRRSRVPQQMLEFSKQRLIQLLWLYGVRKIDRKALAEHSVEAVEAEIEAEREQIQRRQQRIRYYGERLREGVYLKGRGKKGKPLSPAARISFEANQRLARIHVSEHKGRIAHLETLLDDSAIRVREYTGCLRQSAPAEGATS